jgi:hypothetical protein
VNQHGFRHVNSWFPLEADVGVGNVGVEQSGQPSEAMMALSALGPQPYGCGGADYNSPPPHHLRRWSVVEFGGRQNQYRAFHLLQL